MHRVYKLENLTFSRKLFEATCLKGQRGHTEVSKDENCVIAAGKKENIKIAGNVSRRGIESFDFIV